MRLKSRSTQEDADSPFDRPSRAPGPQESGAYSVDGKEDRYGRYRLPNLKSGIPTAFTRMSTFAKTFADTYKLNQWGLRMAIKGVTLDPGLYAMVASTPLEDRNSLNRLAERAKDIAGAKTSASLGTAVHAFTEQRDRGEQVTVPAQWRPDVDAYVAALAEAQLEVVGDMIERIIVVDRYNVAGRWDRVLRTLVDRTVTFPGRDPIVVPAGSLLVGDLKTGRDLEYGWGEIVIQLAGYNHASHLFDTDTRKYVEPPKLWQDTAVVMHLPVGQGKCTIYDIDTAAGWEDMELCQIVRARRNRKGLAVAAGVVTALPGDPAARGADAVTAAADRDEVAAAGVVLDRTGGSAAVVRAPSDVERVEAAVTVADLAALWEELYPAGRWTNDVDFRAGYRREQIMADRAGG